MPPRLLNDFHYARDHRDPLNGQFGGACCHNNAATVFQLVQQCSPSLLRLGVTVAARNGHLDLTRKLLAVGAGWDADTVRAASKTYDGVMFLLENGYDVNTKLSYGETRLG